MSPERLIFLLVRGDGGVRSFSPLQSRRFGCSRNLSAKAGATLPVEAVAIASPVVFELYSAVWRRNLADLHCLRLDGLFRIEGLFDPWLLEIPGNNHHREPFAAIQEQRIREALRPMGMKQMLPPVALHDLGDENGDCARRMLRLQAFNKVQQRSEEATIRCL